MKTIRHATLQDLPLIFEIEQSAFPPHREATKETLEKRLKLSPEGCFVIMVNKKIAGFSIGFPAKNIQTLEDANVTDEELYQKDGLLYWFRELAIHKDFQRSGLGQKLVKKQIENARKLNKSTIRFTAASDVENFYKKLGFTRITDYHPFHNTDQGLWELNLNQ